MHILKNGIQFSSDELYWIQTARILPYITQGNFASSYWHEHMGFTNFNGAKWIYAIGLGAFGHRDFETIGVPPETYYRWNSFDGAPFPETHELYNIIKHGRVISAFMASIAVGLLFLLAHTITGNMYISGLTVFFLLLHPIFKTIATHAFADSIFLVGQLSTYIYIFRISKWRSDQGKWLLYLIIGISLGATISTKITAYMFVPIVMYSIFFHYAKKLCTFSECIKRLGLFFIGMIATFLIVNPNIVFYRSYTPFMMIEDRIHITTMHMDYFRSIDPQHVLDSIPSRIQSLWRHVFTLPLCIGSILSVMHVIYTVWKKQTPHIFVLLFLHAMYITSVLLMYVVFDEERYFLPVLPLICILGSLWIGSLCYTSEEKGRN